MTINIKTLKPAYRIPPGEVLKDLIAERHITLSKMVRLSRLTRNELEDIIYRQKVIDKRVAACIGNALGMNPQLWLNMQKSYEQDKKNTNA